jgi:hypothetical protein
MKHLCVLVIALTAFAACTKEAPKGADGKPVVNSNTSPDRVIFETELSMPKEYVGKVKKTDLMIWDLKDQEGNVVAANVIPVPVFPPKMVVTGRQLFDNLLETGRLIFTARIVKFGDESKPPLKGQLQVMVGMGTTEGAVVDNPSVNQGLLDKWMKKQKFMPGQEISLGGKVTAEFVPASM